VINNLTDKSPAGNMGFAAMAGRRNKLRLCAGIGSSSSVTNNAKQEFFSSKTKQNPAAVQGG